MATRPSSRFVVSLSHLRQVLSQKGWLFSVSAFDKYCYPSQGCCPQENSCENSVVGRDRNKKCGYNQCCKKSGTEQHSQPLVPLLGAKDRFFHVNVVVIPTFGHRNNAVGSTGRDCFVLPKMSRMCNWARKAFANHNRRHTADYFSSCLLRNKITDLTVNFGLEGFSWIRSLFSLGSCSLCRLGTQFALLLHF